MKAIRRGGFRIRKIAETGEFRAPTPARIPNKDIREARAYYTGDAQDARDTAAQMIREDRKKFAKVKAKHPVALKGKVYSNDPNAANWKLGRLMPGMIRLADSRPRDGNGQYVANETGGADPNSMAAAYGGVAAEKEKRIGLLTRLRRTLRPGMVPAPVPGV